MTMIKGRPLDYTGRGIIDSRPIIIPNMTEAQSASEPTAPGFGWLTVNETTSTLDYWVNGGRYQLKPSTGSVEPDFDLSNGGNIDAEAGQAIPIVPNADGNVGTITLPVAPVVGDSVTFFDPQGLFNPNTGVDINATVNGVSGNHEYRKKGGYFELEYVGGTIGWIQESVDGEVTQSTTIAGHTNANVKGTDIDSPGFYVCECPTPDGTYYPPVNDELLTLGDEVVVLYNTGRAHNIYIRTNYDTFAVHNQTVVQYCQEAIVHYRLGPGGWYVIASHFVPPEIATYADYDTLITTVQPFHMVGITVDGIDLKETAYFGGERFDNLLPPISYLKMDDGLHDGYDFTRLPNNLPSATNNIKYWKGRVWDVAGQRNFDIVWRRNDLGSGTEAIYYDFGEEWSVTINDDTTERVFPRIVRKLTLNVEKAGCTSSIEDKFDLYNDGDEIIIHCNQFLIKEGDVFTLKVGTDRFTIDDGTNKYPEVTLTGPGMAVLYKEGDYWKMRHRVKYQEDSLTP